MTATTVTTLWSKKQICFRSVQSSAPANSLISWENALLMEVFTVAERGYIYIYIFFLVGQKVPMM